MATTKKPQDRKPKAVKTAKVVKIQDVIPTLDMDEVDFIEAISRVSIDVLEIPGQPKALFIAAVALVLGRRSTPNLSWAEVRSNTLKENSDLIAENHDLPKVNVSKLKHQDEELSKHYIV